MNEGLATALEPGGMEWVTEQLKRDPTRLTFARLSNGFGRLSAAEAHVAYAQSAVAVKKMIDLRGASTVVALLQALGRGTPFDNAFQHTIFMQYEDFLAMMSREKRWTAQLSDAGQHFVW